MVRLTCVLSAAFLLAACHPGLRPYDGVVGYEFNRNDQSIFVTYTEDSVYGWEFLEAQAAKACKKETGVSPGTLRSGTVRRETLGKEVAVSIVSGGPMYTGGGTVKNGLGGEIRHAHVTSGSESSSVKRTATFNRLIAECGGTKSATAP